MNKIMNSKALLVCAIGFLVALPVLASEITGSLCTGVNCPVEGTVVAAPTASPVAGAYTSNQNVTLSASGATSIRYTIDDTSPTCASTQYTSAISVTSSKTIKAISCYANNVFSTVASFAYTISIPIQSPSSGGGYIPPVTVTTTTTPSASAGVLYAAQVQLLNTLIVQLQSLIKQAQAMGVRLPDGTEQYLSMAPVVPSGASQFARSLTVGSQGEDVRDLQKFLNTKGFLVVSEGSGSLGNETTFFGSLTKNALAKYQASVGISPASGYFGPLTREYINTH